MSDAPATKKEEVAAAPAPKVEEKKPEEPVGDVPDPDEDDLDDLDDMLDDFSKPKVDQTKPTAPPAPATTSSSSAAATAAGPGPSLDDKNLEDLLGDEDFAKQLQAGMADLLGELDKNPEMQKEFDNMFKSMSAAAEDTAGLDAFAAGAAAQPASSSTGAGATASAGASAGAADASFQDTIRRTMERMQASGDQATAAAAESSTEDLLAEMMKQLGQGGGPGLDGSEEDFSKMLMGMMEQLTNKEILHEPMKELHEKFPEWLEKNKATTSAEDLKRYEEQQVLVREIVGKFDERTYSDSNAADREYIVARMQKMQDLGSPPPDLVGDMPSAQDAFGAPDLESCNPQ